MINRRVWLALAAAGAAGLRQARSMQARRPAQPGIKMPPSRNLITVEMPVFEGVWARSADPNDVQTLDYLSSFKPYPLPATPDQQGWIAMAQRALGQEANANLAWRLYCLYHGTRSGSPRGELLDAAAALNFFPESRIAHASGRLPVKLEPWFAFERPLKLKAIVTMVVEDAARKPLGKESQLVIERLEPRELSLEMDAGANTEVFARYTLADEAGKIFAEVRRPVLLAAPNLRDRVARLAESGGKLLLSNAADQWHEIGARTIRRVAEIYSNAFTGYTCPFPEQMHPFVARTMDGLVPRDWTSSVSGESEIAQLEGLAAKLLAGGPHAASLFALPRLVWSTGDGAAEEFFRVLLPDGFSAEDRKWPVVVALHPEFGDQGSLADMFVGADGKSSLLAAEARKRGYIVLLPNAGSPFGWYLEPALTRLPRLVRRFLEVWPGDPKQVFLWGHSLGGSLAFRMLNLRDLWAGVAIVAGRPHPKFDYNTPADIPLALISGGSDPIMPPNQMLVISYRLQRAVKQREMIALDGQDHWSVGAAAIPAAFEYFDKLRKTPAPAHPKPAEPPK